jgi:hypothetical protein
MKKKVGRPEKPKSERRVTLRIPVLQKHEKEAKQILNQIAKTYQ